MKSYIWTYKTLSVQEARLSKKIEKLQSDYDGQIANNQELRDYIENMGLPPDFRNTGKHIGEVGERQQRRKLSALKTDVERALWFAETYGLTLDMASFF